MKWAGFTSGPFMGWVAARCAGKIDEATITEIKMIRSHHCGGQAGLDNGSPEKKIPAPITRPMREAGIT